MNANSVVQNSSRQTRSVLQSLPGYNIRRLHQISVAAVMHETADLSITPVQFACLDTLAGRPGIDQRTLARLVSLDSSTIGGVVDRLEARGVLKRELSSTDRRVRLLRLTPEGQSLIDSAFPLVSGAQEKILKPLTSRQRVDFLHLLNLLVQYHQESTVKAEDVDPSSL